MDNPTTVNEMQAREQRRLDEAAAVRREASNSFAERRSLAEHARAALRQRLTDGDSLLTRNWNHADPRIRDSVREVQPAFRQALTNADVAATQAVGLLARVREELNRSAIYTPRDLPDAAAPAPLN